MRSVRIPLNGRAPRRALVVAAACSIGAVVLGSAPAGARPGTATGPGTRRSSRARVGGELLASAHLKYAPQEIVIAYAGPSGGASVSAHAAAGTSESDSPRTEVIRVPRGQNIHPVLARLRRRRGVLWAVPDLIAHTAGGFIPNDTGDG